MVTNLKRIMSGIVWVQLIVLGFFFYAVPPPKWLMRVSMMVAI